MTAHIPVRAGHPYSPECNCDACFGLWWDNEQRNPPTPAEREARARAFSKALWPAGGGELLTDYPITLPDLDRDEAKPKPSDTPADAAVRSLAGDL